MVPEIVDADGKVLEGETSGNLCIAKSWPGQMRTVYGDHARFEQTYFSTYKGKYFTGDGCRRDADGYYWITGRVDDVINVSGHRMGTAEVESSLVAHAAVSEAAVVGYPHDIKGQGIYAYVTLMTGIEPTEALRKELVAWVRKDIGPIASPDQIQFAPGLPKTRSGKIMRRILRKIAEDEPVEPRRYLDAGRSRRGRRSRREPPEQEGRAGVKPRRRPLRISRLRAGVRPSPVTAHRVLLLPRPGHAIVSRVAALWRISSAECCFQVIYFNSNISFVPLIETRLRPGVETIRLRHAVKNAWARRQTGILQGLQDI